jgi:hypothetical protein
MNISDVDISSSSWMDKNLDSLPQELQGEIRKTLTDAIRSFKDVIQELTTNLDPAIIAMLIPLLKETRENLDFGLDFARRFQKDVEAARAANLN